MSTDQVVVGQFIQSILDQVRGPVMLVAKTDQSYFFLDPMDKNCLEKVTKIKSGDGIHAGWQVFDSNSDMFKFLGALTTSPSTDATKKTNSR